MSLHIVMQKGRNGNGPREVKWFAGDEAIQGARDFIVENRRCHYYIETRSPDFPYIADDQFTIPRGEDKQRYQPTYLIGG